MADAKTQKAAPAEKKDGKNSTKTPRERFLGVGGLRFGNVIAKAKLLRNLAAPSRYEYTREEIAKGFAAIRKEVDGAEEAMVSALEKKAKAPGEKGVKAFDFSG